MLKYLPEIFTGLPWERCFSGFSGDTVWLVIGVFLIASALQTTGLLSRITRKVMSLFKPTYGGQVLALLISGSLIAPLVPSSTAKTVFGSSAASEVADEMGYDAFSRGRTGLFVASFSGYGATVPAFLSASGLTYIMRGMLPAEHAAEVTWISWAAAMLPWLLVFLALSYFAINALYRPKEEGAAFQIGANEKTRVYAGTKEPADLAARGSAMSRDEKIVAVIIASCILLWAAESLVGIPAAAVALAGAAILFLSGVLAPSDFSKAVPWGLVVFIGCVLSLGQRFTDMGLSALLSSAIAPVMGLATSTPAAVLLLYLVVSLSTFVIASQAVPIAVFTSIMPGLLAPMGLSPFIVGVMVLMACNCYFVTYQNLSYIAALENVGDKIRQRDVLPAAFTHVLISATGCLLCLPYWSLLGYITV